MKKLYCLQLILSIVMVLFWGCEKKGDPPVLPPAESMIIDFTEFTAGRKSVEMIPGTKGVAAAENTNWTVAATVAGVWNSILIINLAVPVAAFYKAIEIKPSYLDNKKWEWRYSVNAVGITYNARLTGQIQADNIKWEMYIGREGVGGFPEFLWYEGTTALDGSSGQWIVTHSPQAQVPMLQIDWAKEGSEIGSVKYTYIKTGENFKDSYIEYGLTSNTLNAYYTVHFYETVRAAFVDVNIEWSTTDHNGRIKSVDYFQDTNWHCWDGNGNDITCPN
jgi:hypothetical protein